MSKSPLHDFLVVTPKVENHLHIEGTLEPSMLFRFVNWNNVILRSDPEWVSPDILKARYGKFDSLDDFIHYCYPSASVLVISADFKELAWAYFVKAVDMQIRHIEVSFDPHMHMVRGVKYGVVVDGLIPAKRRETNELNLTIEYITCIHRHLPIGNLTNQPIRGMGLVLSEKRRAEQGTLLTLCPWSNVALNLLPRLSVAPARTFLDAGMRLNLNSDDPAYTGCYLPDVYFRAQETFNLTFAESWIEEKRTLLLQEFRDILNSKEFHAPMH
ncbi:hypothetical protein BDW67DRAFT_192002 [Aspergillus spinulosporus]